MQPKTFFKAKWGIFVGILGIAVVLIVYLVISMLNTSEIQGDARSGDGRTISANRRIEQGNCRI